MFVSFLFHSTGVILKKNILRLASCMDSSRNKEPGCESVQAGVAVLLFRVTSFVFAHAGILGSLRYLLCNCLATFCNPRRNNGCFWWPKPTITRANLKHSLWVCGSPLFLSSNSSVFAETPLDFGKVSNFFWKHRVRRSCAGHTSTKANNIQVDSCKGLHGWNFKQEVWLLKLCFWGMSGFNSGSQKIPKLYSSEALPFSLLQDAARAFSLAMLSSPW